MINNIVQPSTLSLDDVRDHTLSDLTKLMELKIRSIKLDDGILNKVERELRKVSKHLESINDSQQSDSSASTIEKCRQRLTALAEMVSLLKAGRDKRWANKCVLIKELAVEFSNLIKSLNLTLIGRDLFDRQSQVLEKIILSHEELANWEMFVETLLKDFHEIFPFHMFTITFAANDGIDLFIYHMGRSAEQTQLTTKQNLCRRMREELGLEDDSPFNIHEFEVGCSSASMIPTKDNIDFITVNVEDDKIGVGGVLGVGYLTTSVLTPQEESIIRSILSVMVMVVGSSKTLTRTLNELEYYAQHDPLTGLHNRRYFNDLLNYELDRSQRHEHQFAVLMIDMDNFKDVNDRFGHLAGDSVLIQLAQTLRKQLRKGDVLCRIGGDEFAVLLPETNAEEAILVSKALLKAASGLKHTHENETFSTTISIGCSNFPSDSKDFNDLLAAADTALYQAKDAGKDFVCSVSDLRTPIQGKRERFSLAAQLKQAIENDRLIPYFQPIIDIKENGLHAFEALARIKTQDDQVMSAGLFIEAAAQSGQSMDLDHIIVRKVIERLAYEKAHGNPLPKMFINLSPQSIQHRNILFYAEMLCDEYQIPAENIVFEVTEREAIGDIGAMRNFLGRLREKGFSFALDDFGSGYNSFHYLRELHFDYVKIDGAFICNILKSKVDLALVKALSSLCQELGTPTIAEFVEDKSVLKLLQELEINYAQGFYLGLPQSHLNFEALPKLTPEPELT